jgi:hypothetical protein
MFANLSKKPLFWDFAYGRIGTYIGLKQDAAEPKLVHPVILPMNRWRSKKNYEIFPETYRPESIVSYKPPQNATSHSIQSEYVIAWEASNGERPFLSALNSELFESIEKIRKKLDASELEVATNKFKSDAATEESSKKLQKEVDNKQARPRPQYPGGFYPDSFDSRLQSRMGYPPIPPETDYFSEF